MFRRLVSGPDRWLVHEWVDGAVLFDEATGSCHALTMSGAAVCRLCLVHPVFDAVLLTRKLLEDEITPADIQGVESILDRFAEMGFVEPAEAVV